MPSYDLSYPLETGMPVYPGAPEPSVTTRTTVSEEGYATTDLDLASHTGTHVDAPAHMLEDGRALETYDLDTFRFDAVIADCRPLEPREPVTAEMLERSLDAELDDETLRSVDLLICRTGWAAQWGSESAFDHPYLTAGAGEWLLEHDCHCGIDAMNVDPTPGTFERDAEPDGYPFHHVMFEGDRLLLENLRGLEPLPVDRMFTVHAYPLSYERADGSPVRAVGVVEAP